MKNIKADKYVNTLIVMVVMIKVMIENIITIIPKCFEIASTDIILIIIVCEELIEIMVLN
jgi:hypothetical protein